MFNSKQQSTAQVTECIIRVKDGNLVPRGKGTFTMSVMPDGQATLSVTLPSESGVPEPLDLMSLERLELVKTRTGWYQGNQWIGPTVAIIGAVVVPAIILPIFVPRVPPAMSFDWFFKAISEGLVYGTVIAVCTGSSLMYAGSKLTRIARFVAVTHDGQYCVAEMPEAPFRFLQGSIAAMNQHVETNTAPVSTPEMPETEPVPA